MRENINGVPVLFFGFTKEEEDSIRIAIGDSIGPGMTFELGWEIIGNCLKKANINNCAFTSSVGVQFIKVEHATR